MTDYYGTADTFCDHYEREALEAEARGDMAAAETREFLTQIANDRASGRLHEIWPR